MQSFSLGIDIGSTTVKIAVLDADNNLLFADYRRHFAKIQETLRKALPFTPDGDCRGRQVGPSDIRAAFTQGRAAETEPAGIQIALHLIQFH